MIIDFSTMEAQHLANFKGGEKELVTKMFVHPTCRIMRASLEPGATIGMHTHETNSEIIYMLSGCGVVLCDGEREILPAGQAHFCPKGHTHSLRNESETTIEFFAVVPEQSAE